MQTSFMTLASLKKLLYDFKLNCLALLCLPLVVHSSIASADGIDKDIVKALKAGNYEYASQLVDQYGFSLTTSSKTNLMVDAIRSEQYKALIFFLYKGWQFKGYGLSSEQNSTIIKALLKFIDAKELKVVEMICSSGFSVNADSAKSFIAMATKEHAAYLLENCLSTAGLAYSGKSILREALIAHNEAIAKLLINAGVSVDSELGYGESLIKLATLEGDLWQVKFLISSGVSNTRRGPYDTHLAALAIVDGNTEIAEHLIKAKLDPQSEGNLLISTIENKYTELAVLILKNYEFIDKKEGYTDASQALGKALKSKQFNIAKLLLNQGWKLSYASQADELFSNAISDQDFSLVGQLCEAGYDTISDALGSTIESKNTDQTIYLLSACVTDSPLNNINAHAENHFQTILQNHDQTLADLFISKGVSVNRTGLYGASLISSAIYQGDIWQVNYLIKNGASLEPEYGNKTEFIQTAIEKNFSDIALVLIEAGASLSSGEEHSYNEPIDLAMQHGLHDVYKSLINQGVIPKKDEQSFCDISQERFTLNAIRFCHDMGHIPEPSKLYGQALLTAAEYNDLDTLKELLTEKTNIDYLNDDGESALYIAASESHKEIVLALLEHGASVTTYLKNKAPIAGASRSGNIEIIELLISKEVNNKEQVMATNSAFRFKNIEALEYLLSKDFKTDDTLIFEVAKDQNIDVIQFLIRYKSLNLQSLDYNQNNLITHTQNRGSSTNQPSHISFMEQLIDLGVPYKHQNQDNHNALSIALDNSHFNDVRYWVEKGLEIPEALSENFHSQFVTLIEAGNIESISELIKAGISLATVTPDNTSLLYTALENDQTDIAILLINNEAPTALLSQTSGESVLHHAIRKNQQVIIQALIDQNLDLDIRANGQLGLTPLMLALQLKRFSIAQLILEKGANIGIADRQGKRTLDYLSKENQPTLYASIEEKLKTTRSAPKIELYTSQLTDLSIRATSLSPNGLLGIKMNKQFVELWDLKNNRALRLLHAKNSSYDQVYLAELLDNDRILLAAERETSAKIIDVHTGSVLRALSKSVESSFFTKAGNSYLYGAAISPDQSSVALSFGTDVELYELNTLKKLGDWRLSGSTIKQLKFSNDGTELSGLGGNSDGDLETTTIANILQNDQKKHESFSVLSNDRLIKIELLAVNDNGIAISSDGSSKFEIWNINQKRMLSRIDTKGYPIEHIVFSPQGNHFLLTHASDWQKDEELSYWSVDTKRTLWRKHLDLSIEAPIDFVGDHTLALLMDNKKVQILDANTGELLNNFRSTAISDPRHILGIDDNHLVLSGVDKRNQKWLSEKWDLSANILVSTRESTQETGTRGLKKFDNTSLIEIDSNAKVSILNSKDLSTVKQYTPFLNAHTLKENRAFGGESCLTNSLSGSLHSLPDNKIVFECWNEGVYVADLTTNSAKRLMYSHVNIDDPNHKIVAVSPNGKHVLTGHEDHKLIRILNSDQPEKHDYMAINYDDRHFIDAMDIHGKYAVTASSKRQQLKLWDIKNGKELGKFIDPKYDQYVTGLNINGPGNRVISWAINTLKVWSIPDRKLIYSTKFEGEIRTAALSPSGDSLAVSLDEDSVQLQNIATGKVGPLIQDFTLRVRHLDFSNDGEKLLTGGQQAKVWDTKTGQLLHSLHSDTGWVEKAYFDKTNTRVQASYRVAQNDYYRSKFYCINWDLETGSPTNRIDDCQILDQSETKEDIIYRSNLDPNHLFLLGKQDEHPMFLPFDPYGRTVIAFNDKYTLHGNKTHLISLDHQSNSINYFETKEAPGDSYDEEPLRKIIYSENRRWAAYQNNNQVHIYDTKSKENLGCVVTKFNDLSHLSFDQTSLNVFAEKLSGESLQARLSRSNCQEFSLTSEQVTNLNPITFISKIENRKPTLSKQTGLSSLATISGDKKIIAFTQENTLRTYNLETGKIAAPIESYAQIKYLTLSEDGSVVGLFHNDGRLVLRHTFNGAYISSVKPKYSDLTSLQIDSANETFKTVTMKENETKTICSPYCSTEVISVKQAIQHWDYAGKSPSKEVEEIKPLPSKYIKKNLNTSDGIIEVSFKKETPFTVNFADLSSAEWSKDKRYLYANGAFYDSDLKKLFDYSPPETLTDHDSLIQFVDFISEKHALVVHGNGVFRIVDLKKQQIIATTKLYPDNSWVTYENSGRYDSDTPGNIPYAAWVADDAPLTGLPIEVFLNEYFEPRLLPRILQGEEFGKAIDLLELNRVQPAIAIKSIVQDPETGSYSLTVDITNTEETIRKQGDLVTQISGLREARLFRNGKQVAYKDLSDQENLKAGETVQHVLTGLKLPSYSHNETFNFTAYVFNEDGIKSPNSEITFKPERESKKRKPKAYIVAIGVNEYENPSWNLDYASADAQVILDSITQNLAQTNKYQSVIEVPLISEKTSAHQPTKERILATFDLLSGREVPAKLKNNIPNSAFIDEVTPDDLVVVSFAGHGFASDNGSFHLFPWDIGTGSSRKISDTLLNKTIQSTELDRALRDIDAGEFIFIIDACNSSASVSGSGFKPGPMGSRGLGQLAYNKGMKILAASEEEAVALESPELKHGLLTYSLIVEGLLNKDADQWPKDSLLNSSELLSYTMARVPELHASLLSGNKSIDADRGVTLVDDEEKTVDLRYIQKPSLFDFNKNNIKPMIIGDFR